MYKESNEKWKLKLNRILYMHSAVRFRILDTILLGMIEWWFSVKSGAFIFNLVRKYVNQNTRSHGK